jgi:hypothetical protein
MKLLSQILVASPTLSVFTLKTISCKTVRPLQNCNTDNLDAQISVFLVNHKSVSAPIAQIESMSSQQNTKTAKVAAQLAADIYLLSSAYPLSKVKLGRYQCRHGEDNYTRNGKYSSN